MPDFQEIKFTVDSELLRELGERLVGRQYIALAELVKNSFDADATRVVIRIRPKSIEVSDNGHGMTYEDFATRWMRVGSTHKVEEVRSPGLGRPLTGSKGVGRLAVQFLASALELISVPSKARIRPGCRRAKLRAMVDWDAAVQAQDLTSATAQYSLTDPRSKSFPLDKPHGTTVRLKRLKHDWSPKEFEALAREVWFLQPPFRGLATATSGAASDFDVVLSSPDPDAVSLFQTQMARILDLYSSRLVGRLLPQHNSPQRKVQLSLQLEGQPAAPYEYSIPIRNGDRCLLDTLEFEIRIFTLQHRQPYGIPVQQARDYMEQWGGVHIYDAGFRIPYAGPDADWLRLEFDHSHRLTQSQLLPPELNVPMGLNFLPTNSRVLGVVRVDTTHEARVASLRSPPSAQYLQIQVSRDRLIGNDAFHQLRDAVRFALDYYAIRLATLRLEEKAATGDVETPRSLVEGVWEILEQHEKEIPHSIATKLRTELSRTIDSVREQSEWSTNHAGLLGAMATIGATAVAFDHQFHQQLTILEHHAASLDKAIGESSEATKLVGGHLERIKGWIRAARATRTIFSPITDERNRTARGRFRARRVVQRISRNMDPLLRGVTVDPTAIDPTLLLPEATYPVWMAVFHNVFLNASNAMLDSPRKRIGVSSFESASRRGIRVQDTGVGMDLAKAQDLFRPLERALDISSERRALGYGGAGLGLAIVRMLATDLRAEVRFVKPTQPFTTCFELAWEETG